MGLKAGWLALFFFVWIIGAFLGSTFDYQNASASTGQTYSAGTATFTQNSKIVTGAATTWVAGMVGGNIKCNADGKWYKIQAVGGVGSLTLYTAYTSTTAAGAAYAMQPTPGWAGEGTGGYASSPVNKLEYLLDISNAFQRLSFAGNLPLPVPNPKYFTAAFDVLTWKWSFLEGNNMFYWIFCAPFVIMGVLCMILLVYGFFTGNISM
jgi:hypothetical protein